MRRSRHTSSMMSGGRAVLAVPAFVALGCASAGGGAPGGPPRPATSGRSSAPAPAPAPAAAPAPALVDRGAFAIRIQDQVVGREEFSVHRRGDQLEIRVDTEINAGGVAISSRGTVRTSRSWAPVAAEATFKRGEATTTLELARDARGLVVTSRQAGGAAHEQRAHRPSDLFLGDNMLSLMTAGCALAGDRRRELVVFPDVPLALEPPARRSFLVNEAGIEVATELAVIVADLAGTVRVELVCDGDRLVAVRQPIAGLSAARPGYEQVAAALQADLRPKPSLPDSLVELPRVVKVPAGGTGDPVELACSLTVPRASITSGRKPRVGKRLPAIVFLSGSGPQDRDGDTPGAGGLKLAMFKTLAIALGRANIASMRCDDRGVGGSTGSLRGVTLQALVADARAVVAALRDEPTVDPARIGLIGHSEGGVIAPLVAGADARIRAIALLAGTGRPLDQVLLEQLEARLRAFGTGEDEIRRSLAEAEALYRAIRNGEPLPDGVPGSQRDALQPSVPWLHSHIQHDPAAYARTLGQVAVLIAQGGRDRQVSVRDAELLVAGFEAAGNKRVSYKLYPELNHVFAATRTGSLADYSDPSAELDAACTRDLIEFFAARL